MLAKTSKKKRISLYLWTYLQIELLFSNENDVQYFLKFCKKYDFLDMVNIYLLGHVTNRCLWENIPVGAGLAKRVKVDDVRGEVFPQEDPLAPQTVQIVDETEPVDHHSGAKPERGSS